MLLEGVTGSLSLGSLLEATDVWPFNVELRTEEETERTGEAGHKETVFLLGYLVWFWATLYLLYDKCLNSLLRRMQLPLVQRNRIIEAAWNCGFLFGSVCFLHSSNSAGLGFASRRLQMSHQELGIILHKSFYFHRAGLSFLNKGVSAKAWADFFFAAFVLTPYQKRWCSTIGKLLYLKAIDGLIINACRILAYIPQSTGRKFAKLLFSLHCLSWTYLYAFFVPKHVLWSEKIEQTRVELGFWLWFVAEGLDSVWRRLHRSWTRAPHWLEMSIFPPPTKEAIELASIRKRQTDSAKLNRKRKTRRVEMLQTLMNGLAVKRFVKRMAKTIQQCKPGPPVPTASRTDSDGPSAELKEAKET